MMRHAPLHSAHGARVR